MRLRPFFSYYGGKWRTARMYPEPIHASIVEPFAGSAGYSLHYPDRRVTLLDIDPIVCGVWAYLTKVSAAEILSIPDLAPNGTVDDLRVPEEAKWLVGFWLNRGASSPRRSPSAWMRSGIRPGCFWGKRVRQTIASQVGAIRHWRVQNRDYRRAPMRTATWFVDPPYELAGSHYRFGAKGIDFSELGAWSQGLPGQVIVCENAGAKWLPFTPLVNARSMRGRSKEVAWTP